MTDVRRNWQPVALGGDVPPPAGAYSPAVRAGDFIFVSGQVPRNLRTGQYSTGDVEEQTRLVISNLAEALGAAGATLSDVVSMTVYLADPDLWGRFNAAYREVMPEPYPSRTAIGCILKGILVEVSAVAYVPRHPS